MLNKGIISSTITFLLIAIGIFVLSLPYQKGIDFSDPVTYTKCAYYLVHGQWIIKENFFASRLGVILPLAFAIKIFGYGKWLTLVTLCEFILSILLLHRFNMRLLGKQVAWMTSLFLALSPILLQHSAMVMGDVLLMFVLNFSVLLYFKFLNDNSTSARKMGIAVALTWTYAFLIKETALFYFPLFGIFLVLDYRNLMSARIKKFWFSVFYAMIACTIGMALLYGIPTGNPLIRFAGAIDNQQTAVALAGWYRYIVGPAHLIINDFTFGILLLFALLNVFSATADRQDSLFKIYFVITLMAWWFLPTSPALLPAPLITRQWFPVLIPMLINAMCAIKKIQQNKIPLTRVRLIATLFGVTALALCYSTYLEISGKDSEALGLGLMSLGTIAFAVCYALNCLFLIVGLQWFKEKTVFAIFLLMLSGSAGIDIFRTTQWLRGPKITDTETEAEMAKFALAQGNKVILTDPWMAKNYEIYTGFKKSTRFKDYQKADSAQVLHGAILFVNKKRLQYLKEQINETLVFSNSKYTLSPYVLSPDKYGHLLKRADGIEIYALN